MASSSSTTRMRGSGSLMRASCAVSPAEEPAASSAPVLALQLFLGPALVDGGADLLAVLVGAMPQPLASDLRPRALFLRRAESAELPIAPQLVFELLLDELHHNRVVEEAERRDVIGNQVVGVREVRESREHLVLHRLRRLVFLVEDDLCHVLEGLDRVE